MTTYGNVIASICKANAMLFSPPPQRPSSSTRAQACCVDGGYR